MKVKQSGNPGWCRAVEPQNRRVTARKTEWSNMLCLIGDLQAKLENKRGCDACFSHDVPGSLNSPSSHQLPWSIVESREQTGPALLVVTAHRAQVWDREMSGRVG
jgi:hypothetical protein